MDFGFFTPSYLSKWEVKNHRGFGLVLLLVKREGARLKCCISVVEARK